MTEKAIKLIKELAELNEKVHELELQLKKELTGFDTKEEIMKQPVPENKEYKKKLYEDYKDTDIEDYFEDPYDEIYEKNEACYDCNNPRCKKQRVNNIYLKDILPQGNFLEYLFRHGNRTVCDLMYDNKERMQTYSVNFDNVASCFCTNEDLYRLYTALKKLDITMINYDQYNIDYNKDIDNKYFKMSLEDYVNNGIISVAIYHAFRRANCYSIGDIKLVKDLDELKKTRTVGKKTFSKMIEFIQKENI